MKLSLSAPTSGTAPRLLAFASLLLFSAASVYAQTSAPAQQTTAQAGSQQYTGVATPPEDDAIVTSDESAAPTTSQPKPSPGEPVATVPGAPAEAVPSQPAVRVAAPSSVSHAAPTVENPDYGIVTSTNDPAALPMASTGDSAHLVSRPVDPSYGIVDMVPAGPNELAEGTDIHVRMLDALSTTRTEDGQLFRAQVARDVYKDGRVVIPVGSELRGRVVQVTQGHRLGSRATIRLRPDDVILPDGTAYHLYAEAVGTGTAGTRTDNEGGIQSSPHYAKDLTEYGAGAGGGAIVGGVFGGPVGAGAGAIVGTGVVTTHMLLQKPAQAKLERGSEVVFSLTEPMQLLATRN